MKILYCYQHFSTPAGSTGTRSYTMARRLLERGHEVTIVCGSYGAGKTGLHQSFAEGCRRGRVDGIDIIEFDLAYANSDGFLSRSWTFLKFAWRSMTTALREPYDVLFATTTPLTAAMPGIAARWLRAKPFVFEVRDLWPELPRAMGVIRNPAVLWAMSLLEWLGYRSAHRLIGLSPGIVEGIMKRGVSRERIVMVSNGCDLDFFGCGVEPWRPEGVSPNELLAVYAGTHGIANGLDAVLDAAGELMRRNRGRGIRFLLIGDGKLKSFLQQRVEREGLLNVLFHDPVSQHRLAGLLAGADIGIQVLADVPAFYYGTSPNKFFDYIAAGLPVLNNYPGWLADLIAEHRCGFVVPPASPSAFADALEQASEGRRELEAMGVRSRRLAESDFSRSKLADRWVDWVTEGR